MTTTLITAPPAEPEAKTVLYAHTPATIQKLADRLLGLKVNGVDDKAGYDLVHEGRMECVKARTGIEKTRVLIKAEPLALCKRIDDEAKKLTAMIEPIEQHLLAEEEVIDRERERLKQIEADRVYGIRLEMMTAAGAEYPEAILRAMSEAQFHAACAAESERSKIRKAQAEAAAAAEAERQRVAAEQAEANRIEAERLAAERAAMQAEQDKRDEARRIQQQIDDNKRAAAEAEFQRKQEARQAELDRQQAEQDAARAKIDAEIARLAKVEQDRLDAIEAERVKTEEAEKAAALLAKLKAQKIIDDEAKRVADLAAAKRAESLKPIRDKLLKFADDVLRLETPDTEPNIDAAVLAVLNGAADAIRRIARGAA